MTVRTIGASLETVNLPNVAYRLLADFPVHYDLVLVRRLNEPSPAVRRSIEIGAPPLHTGGRSCRA